MIWWRAAGIFFLGKSTILYARRGLRDSNQKTRIRYSGNLKYEVQWGVGVSQIWRNGKGGGIKLFQISMT